MMRGIPLFFVPVLRRICSVHIGGESGGVFTPFLYVCTHCVQHKQKVLYTDFPLIYLALTMVGECVQQNCIPLEKNAHKYPVYTLYTLFLYFI